MKTTIALKYSLEEVKYSCQFRPFTHEDDCDRRCGERHYSEAQPVVCWRTVPGSGLQLLGRVCELPGFHNRS